MKLLQRNKQTIYYRNLESTEAATVTDEWGNVLETGEKTLTYGEIHAVKGYVKSAIGTSPAEPFGDFTDKRRTIYLEKGIAGIDEYTQIWVGIDPSVDSDTGEPATPYNFRVDGVADGINHIRIAISKVEVNG